MAPDALVDPESRQGPAGPRAKDGAHSVTSRRREEHREMLHRVIPERTVAPLAAFTVKGNLSRRFELKMFDAKIGDFLDASAGVVEEAQ